MLTLRDAMDRLFQESFVRPWGWIGQTDGGMMPIDMYEQDDALVVKTALPGIKPEDVDIRVEGDTLTITGEMKSDQEQPQAAQTTTTQQPAQTQPKSQKNTEQDGQTQAMTSGTERGMQQGQRNWYMREQRYARYSRSITLPFPVNEEQAEATFNQGMLTLRLPKAEKARAKRISIKSQ
jgi:HSP20 family protein